MTRILRGEIKGNTAKLSRNQITDFFKKREPSEDDMMKVAEILTDSSLYQMISQLRKGVLDKDELVKLTEEIG